MMKRSFLLGFALLLILNLPSHLSAITIDFEDLSGTGGRIPYGYHGFEWKASSQYMGTISSAAYPGTGYTVLDPDGKIAYNWYGIDPSTISLIGEGTFDFNYADWTAYSGSGGIRLLGYNDGNQIYSAYNRITSTSILHWELNWTGIDMLRIDTQLSSTYALDNFTYNTPVPEPATILLLGTGIVGLAAAGRKKFLRK